MGHITGVHTVVETDHYLSRAGKRLTADERREVVDFLASDPEAGAVMEGTGGFRKMRFGTAGRGKSGGVRVVYLYVSPVAPLFLVEIFAKSEKANLSPAERNDLAKVSKAIKAQYRSK